MREYWLNSPEDHNGTEDIHTKLFLILLPSSTLASTPDCHDSCSLTFDFQTASMALLTLTQKYHWAICSQSAWTKYCVIWVNKGKRKTKHPCNGAPRRWVINLTVKGQTTTAPHSRWAFSFPSSKKCRGRVSNNCCNPGDGKRRGRIADCARLLAKHLSLLVLTPSLNTPQLLFPVAFHTHKISLGYYACVGQSVRSEGTRNKTLLCICQAVPTALPSQPFSGHIRIGGGALLKRGHGTRGAASSFEIPQIFGGQMTNNKEVGPRVSPRGSEPLSPHGALARDQNGQSARALISAFYVLKTLHLHSHVFSCSLSSAECLRMVE